MLLFDIVDDFALQEQYGVVVGLGGSKIALGVKLGEQAGFCRAQHRADLPFKPASFP